MPRIPVFVFTLLLVALCAPSAQADSFIMHLPNKPIPGGAAVVGPGEEDPPSQAFYQSKPVLVVREKGRHWITAVDILPNTKPGPQKLEVQVTAGNHKEHLSVSNKHYREWCITLKNKCQINPLPEDLKRIERELARQTTTCRRFNPGLPSNLILDKPVDDLLSSSLSLRCFLNDEECDLHSGLDLVVPADTPIKALAAGKVILIGDYFFNGEMVFVDHGQGFVSMFCRLSKISMKLGQQASCGGVFGKVGTTGRATRPYIHWNISLNGARVDPATSVSAFQP